MLDKLAAALAATKYSFANTAWSKAPAGDYGTYYCSGQSQFCADGNSAAEIGLEGYVDYFTRDPSGTPKTTIENALRGLGINWWLNSIQYEDDTGYIHYEWMWRDLNGAV